MNLNIQRFIFFARFKVEKDFKGEDLPVLSHNFVGFFIYYLLRNDL